MSKKKRVLRSCVVNFIFYTGKAAVGQSIKRSPRTVRGHQEGVWQCLCISQGTGRDGRDIEYLLLPRIFLPQTVSDYRPDYFFHEQKRPGGLFGNNMAATAAVGKPEVAVPPVPDDSDRPTAAAATTATATPPPPLPAAAAAAAIGGPITMSCRDLMAAMEQDPLLRRHKLLNSLHCGLIECADETAEGGRAYVCVDDIV